jgi:hypothetical protein
MATPAVRGPTASGPMARFHLPFASEAETVYRSLTHVSAGA